MGNNYRWLDDMLILIDEQGDELRPKSLIDDLILDDDLTIKQIVETIDDLVA